MEPTLPVWTVRPNWKGGILERLEWLTDVLTSSTGAEQRRALRLSPRRSLEITINPTQNERTFVDLLLHKLGSNDWLFPLWFDKGKLSASAAPGDERVNFDNTYREHGVGGLALLYRDAWTWEVISISGQDEDGLDLDAPLDAAWPKGTVVYPLRHARLQNETELNALSSRVGESVLLWTMVEANEWPAIAPTDQIFEGTPVLVNAPNRSASLTVNHTRLTTERDNQTGIPERVDSAGRAFQVQSHSWMRHGRQQQAEFRSMLYWLRGRQRAVWLPSFNEDIVASRASATASVNLDVQKIGLAYAGGLITGRDVVRINGIPARITALGAPQSPQEERLRIGAGLTAAVPKGARGSFMSPARLNQDSIEILHHADSDGAIECSTTFKTFSDTRDSSGAIFYPLPETAKSPGGCGAISNFNGLSWRLPCGSHYGGGGNYCTCPGVVSDTFTIAGNPAVIYNASLRVRGVVELGVNIYRLIISDPPQDIRLNPGAFDPFALTVLDYVLDVTVRGGAAITLFADSTDGGQVRNATNLSAPDDDPSRPIVVTQPYNGQFIQIDGDLSE